MKTPEEMVRFEFSNDIEQMVKEILRLRAEKTTYPIPVYPYPVYPQLPEYPWQTWITCSSDSTNIKLEKDK